MKPQKKVFGNVFGKSSDKNNKKIIHPQQINSKKKSSNRKNFGSLQKSPSRYNDTSFSTRKNKSQTKYLPTKNSYKKNLSKNDRQLNNHSKKSSNQANKIYKKSFQKKAINLEQYKHFKGVYYDSSGISSYKKGLLLYTKSNNFESVYGEKIVAFKGDPYRFWDPKRSKICSAIHNGISQIGILPGKRVLYLGASSGTTVSHVSDILGDEGLVFAVEFSDTPAKKLYFLAKERNNILPILADARNPKAYFPITGVCDIVFQDLSQKDQIEIFFRNCKTILKEGGFGILSLKTRSIDVRLSPKSVFANVKPILEKNMTLVDYRSLEPFEEGHYIFVLKN
jgi:fibrillarin-like pre-rRNA processing protein